MVHSTFSSPGTLSNNTSLNQTMAADANPDVTGIGIVVSSIGTACFVIVSSFVYLRLKYAGLQKESEEGYRKTVQKKHVIEAVINGFSDA
ncbi:hypothetical protein MN608_04369 [Microdochium nivale]|nr:hypothetical protein MN608_04369 [Microdochium nivale]